MIHPKGILHFTLPVSDVDRSTAFFVDVLGCTLLTRNKVMAFLQAGEDYFILARSDTPIQPNAAGQTRVHHAFMVEHDAFDAAMSAMKAKGVDILRYEHRREGAFTGRQFYIHDPDRNVIEIIAYEGRGPEF